MCKVASVDASKLGSLKVERSLGRDCSVRIIDRVYDNRWAW